MSGDEVRQVSREDIQLVQNLIEQCLQLHMNKKEVMNTLLVKAKIEPGFTELVWQKLEEENAEFFKAYHLRLLVKDQIIQFNQLLEKQVELMHQLSDGPTPGNMPNESHIAPMGQNSACYGQEYPSSSLQPLGSSLYTNGCPSSINPCMQGTVDISNDARRTNNSTNMLMTHSSNMGLVQGMNINGYTSNMGLVQGMNMNGHTSNMGLVQGMNMNGHTSNMELVQGMNMNGQMMKPDTGYINAPPCLFGHNGDVLGTHHAAGDMSVSSFNNVESHPQPMNNIFLGTDTVYGSLGNISRNFSFSDLTADFSLGSDILDSYSGSPFLDSGLNSFNNSQYQVGQQDNRRFDNFGH